MDKSYRQRFTSEVFTVSKIIHNFPITHQVKDENGEVTIGSFYEAELQLIKWRTQWSSIHLLLIMLGDQFSLVLTSNCSVKTYPNNKLNEFTVDLPYALNLYGNYQAALERIMFPRNWSNVGENNVMNVGSLHYVDGEENYVMEPKSLRPGCYQSVEDIVIEFKRAVSNQKVQVRYMKSEQQTFFRAMPGARLYEAAPSKNTRVTDLFRISNYIALKDGKFDYRSLPSFTKVKTQPRDASLSSYLKFDLNLGCPHLVVLLDIIRDSIFSDNLLPLLDTVPITKPRDLQTHSYAAFGLPTFKNITRDNVTSIKAMPLNDFLAPFPFGDTGRVVLTLKFKRNKQRDQV